MRGYRDMSFSPRYLVAVNLVLLALAAYSASSIVGTALASRLIPPPEVEISAPPPPIEQEPAKPATFYASIHTRDIFNSAKPEAPPVEAPVVVTPLKLKLWGVALHRNSDRSYCIIEDLTARKQAVYGINAPVPGGATVKTIEWNRVILARNGKDEVLELAEPGQTGGPGAKGTGAVAGVGGVPGGGPGGIAAAGANRPGASVPTGAGIQQTGENEFQIQRSEVDSALENMSQLFTQVRAVPHFEGGQSTGFRLFAIRRGSIFDRIGLKNGDIIRSINGNAMNDPTRALALFQELRGASDVTVDLTRNQQPQTLSYHLQ